MPSPASMPLHWTRLLSPTRSRKRSIRLYAQSWRSWMSPPSSPRLSVASTTASLSRFSSSTTRRVPRSGFSAFSVFSRIIGFHVLFPFIFSLKNPKRMIGVERERGGKGRLASHWRLVIHQRLFFSPPGTRNKHTHIFAVKLGAFRRLVAYGTVLLYPSPLP